ncbi:MAG: hypothetical protein M3280_09805 [Actinomycetota bacterium]|nr:hypothetical protein [Actinomycetota bacterium]
MTRWLALPLSSALLLMGSGFLSSLEKTTEESARLAATSEEAPRETKMAAREVARLPEVADLASRQAAAFDALADALEVSAGRVEAFNSTLASQVRGLGELRGAVLDLLPPAACAGRRLGSVLRASRGTPDAVLSISSSMEDIIEAQNKSIRHLKSINRKLTALGAVATASDVEPPPLPEDVPQPSATGSANPIRC